LKSTRGSLLVINDDPTQLRLACALLEREGYRVLAASGAAEGLRILERESAIVGVVTDLHMPEIDGWRFCRLLRSPAYRDFNRLPVLVVSATFSGDDALAVTRELGANGFLPAPYQPATLLRYVGDMLEGRAPAATLDVLLVQAAGVPTSLLETCFGEHGYQVHTARSVDEGRGLFHAHRPGIVVLDHHLDPRAMELLAEVKRPGSPSVALVTTREHSPELALELMQAGADGYVREIYDPEYVVTLGERAVRQRALLRVEEVLEQRTHQLRASEQQLRAIFRALPEIVLVYDRAGVLLQVNPAATLSLGRETSSLIGRNVRELVTDDRLEEFGRNLARPGVRGAHRYETVYLAPAGRRLEVEVTESPISIRDKQAILAVARDVGERRRAQEELALLAAAVRQAAEMIIVTSTDGRIRYVNPAFEHITGYRREEAVGARLEMLRGEDEEEPWEQMRRRLQQGASWRGRMRRRRKDGRTYVAQGTFSPVREENGTVVYWVGVEQDVTQEEELEGALRQAQKMEAIGTLAGGGAHDFNNLLTGILGYASLIGTSAPAGSELAQMAHIIESSAERASHLTRELLGFARRGKDRNVPIDLRETVDQVLHLVSRTIRKEIRLRTELELEHAFVVGDPSQVEQALLNLALNARDALAERKDGEIAITLRQVELDEVACARHPGTNPGRYFLVTVRDNGIGMPPEVQSRVFEPFFTTKKRGEGTGMGLSMTYGIVKNHGGSITVASEVGEGTTFEVYLPRDEGAAQEPEEPVEQAEPVRGTGRILIVDDEEVVRAAASAMLKHLGYEVVSLADGEEAVLYYRHFGDSIDLVLLDMVMPGMGGHDCFAALKEIDPGVRVVLSTGFGLNDDAQAILDGGAQGFAKKPYRVADLSRVVAAVLRGERHHGEPLGSQG